MYNHYRFVFNPKTGDCWLSHFCWDKKHDVIYSANVNCHKASEKLEKCFAEHGTPYFSEVFHSVLIEINKSTR